MGNILRWTLGNPEGTLFIANDWNPNESGIPVTEKKEDSYAFDQEHEAWRTADRLNVAKAGQNVISGFKLHYVWE